MAGRILWPKNRWISYIDGLLQVYLLHGHFLKLPSRITSIKINPKEVTRLLQDSSEGISLFLLLYSILSNDRTVKPIS